MPNTFRRNFYSPYGTLKATTTAVGTTTTFDVSNAEGANLTIGDKIKIYGLFIFTHTLRDGLVTISNKQVDTPTLGTTRITFGPALTGATQNGDKVYLPEVVDVNTWISNNMTQADGILGAFPCTSATRPNGGTRFPDMVIFERDTKNLMRWNNGATVWELINNVDRARGRKAYASSNVAGATCLPGDHVGPYLPITLNVESGQWYEVFFSVNVEYVTGSDAEAFAAVRIQDGATVDVSSNSIGFFGCDANGLTVDGTNNRGVCAYQAPSSKQITIGLFLDRASMAATPGNSLRFAANTHNMMCIEDVGQ